MGASTGFLEIQELINDINRERPTHRIIGLLDDNPKLHGQSVDGTPVLGPLELAHDHPDAGLVFGIGSPPTRLLRHRIIDRLAIPEERFVSLVHPTAKVYPSASVGHGAIIHSNVVLADHVRLDGFNIVTFGALLASQVHLGRFAMVSSLVVLLSRVDVGPGCFIGATACIQDDIRVGAGALVGMASAVYRNVAPGAVALGNPARVAYRVRVPPELEALGASMPARSNATPTGGTT